ncbi:hypothetical protein HWV62_19207 [Athelia sp. TMB]|nr:hypothetical protein HWV62_19207 [Athelia sp. TMB]
MAYDGLDVYTIGKTLTFLREVKFEQQDTPSRTPVRVTFVHGGDCIASGAETGALCVWETATGDQFQVLGREGQAMQEVAASQTNQFSYIASASSRPSKEPFIKVWRAKRNSTTAWLDRLATLLKHTGTFGRDQTATVEAVVTALMTLAIRLSVLFGLIYLVQIFRTDPQARFIAVQFILSLVDYILSAYQLVMGILRGWAVLFLDLIRRRMRDFLFPHVAPRNMGHYHEIVRGL